ncbi:AcrR family transcriptional regulator [Kineococcus radiotolerans]|uniref:AcrR family transcriptional regulator n=1 Tax=Kineococcus radiotolerans TaxID=131568 RepID=A0A7W4TQB7_KINRA|nr:TetR/AcrR family transcriptional regulator [Kineococcus radiotolerans]MBB2903156.1 AcrR family transcriptional regulator [Kineococcus radiotolerans]
MEAREAIATAALDLAAEGGLEAVSVRTVAARAGVSPGLVQHHYKTKQHLLLAAMERVSYRVQTRLESAATATRDASPAQQLRHLALQLLPMDEQRRVEARVWLAFVARAAVDEEVAALHSQEWRALQQVFAELLAARRHAAANETAHPANTTTGNAVTTRDEDEAAHLLAALDGMAIAGIAETDRMTPARMHRLVNHLLGTRLMKP